MADTTKNNLYPSGLNSQRKILLSSAGRFDCDTVCKHHYLLNLVSNIYDIARRNVVEGKDIYD